MSESVAAGPERITLSERLVGLFHIPFIFGCAALTALIGFPGNFVAYYLDTMNVEKTFTLALSNSGIAIVPVGTESLLQGVGRVIIYNVFLFLVMYSTKYLRRRIVLAESELSPLSQKGEQGFHQAFGGVSSPAGTAVFALFLGIPYVLARVLSSGWLFGLLYSAVGTSLGAVVIATMLWEYLYVLWGLRKFGMTDLELKPYYIDRMFGLRPLGTISLSFGAVFCGLAGLALVGGTLSNNPLNMGITVALLSFGLVMLFLPLNGIHRKMTRQKQVEQRAMQRRLSEVISRRAKADGHGVESRLEEISGLIELHIERDEISNIPTWPFDTRILERLVAVVVAVITVVLARLAQLALRI